MHKLSLDPAHPGQYLACRGFQTICSVLLGRRSEGTFVDNGFGFLVEEDPCRVLQRISESLAVPVNGERDSPVVLLGFRLDWWKTNGGSRFKLWGGPQGTLQLTVRMQQALRGLVKGGNPFRFGVPMSGRFGFDPGAGWTTTDVGYSPKRVGEMVMTFPVLELMAFVGMQLWKPQQVDRELWEYRILGNRYRFPIRKRNKYYSALGWALPFVDEDEFRVRVQQTKGAIA